MGPCLMSLERSVQDCSECDEGVLQDVPTWCDPWSSAQPLCKLVTPAYNDFQW